MKKIIIILSLAAITLLSSCGLPMRFTDVRGSGKSVTETRHISTVKSVELSGIGMLVIEQGNEESLQVTADENLIKYLDSRVEGSTLILSSREFINIHPQTNIVYHLVVKDLSTVETSGLGNIEIKALEADNLFLKISGTGSITIDDLQADVLDVDISGMGNVDLTGNVSYQSIKISGAGNYKAPDLFSRTAVLEISGTGGALIWVTNDLNLGLSGMGSLEYYGEPVLNTEISGMGTVKSLGQK